MGWLRENVHWLLFVAFLFSTAATVGVGVVALLSSLSALLAGGPLLAALAGSLEVLALYVIPLVLLGMLDVVLLLSAVWIGIRRFSFRSLVPSVNYRSDRLSRWAGDLEARIPFLRPLGLSAKLEPTAEQRRERLKELYVEGEIGDEAFERKMARLVDDEPAAPDVIEETEIPVRDDPGPGSDPESQAVTDPESRAVTDPDAQSRPDPDSREGSPGERDTREAAGPPVGAGDGRDRGSPPGDGEHERADREPERGQGEHERDDPNPGRDDGEREREERDLEVE